MDPFITDIVANFVNIEPLRFHNQVMNSAIVQVAFTEYRVFVKARTLPWSLCSGDPVTNLEALISLPRAEVDAAHPIVRNIRSLLAIGFPKTSLGDAVKLLAECSWSSYLTEKFHASAATVRKFHPDLSPDSLMARSLLHQVRQMLPSVSPEQRNIARLHKQWLSTLAKQETRINARHVFLSDVMQERRRVNEARTHSGSTHLINPQKVMTLLSKHFNELSQREKEVLQKRALDRRQAIRDASAAELTQIEVHMQTLRRQTVLQSENRSTTMSFASSTLSDTTMIAVQSYVGDIGSDKARLQRMRHRTMQEPVALQSKNLELCRQKSQLIDDDAHSMTWSETAKAIIRDYTAQ
eukprot:6487582-Amphidinium_carterae.3